MKGFRTLAAGLAVAVLPTSLTYLGNVDWTQMVGPNAALLISGLLTIGLRVITTTSVGRSA